MSGNAHYNLTLVSYMALGFYRRKGPLSRTGLGVYRCCSKKSAMIRAEVYLANSGIEGLMEELVILVPVIEEPRCQWKAPSPSACFFTRW